MILSPRRLAGCTLTFAAFALAALSGTVSFTGISALLPSIPGIGFLGFVIAVTTVALGVAVVAEAIDRRWRSVLVYGGLLGLVACSDVYTNILALQGQVSEATQATADRNQRFEAASETLANTRAELAVTHDRIALMNAEAPDAIKTAQTYLASKGLYMGAIDGIRGGQTLAAMRAHGADLSNRLATLQQRETELLPTVAAGADVVEAPFSMADAQLYGLVITLFGITLSFAGSALINSGKALEDREADVSERETDMEQFEEELLEVLKEDDDYAHDIWQTTYAIRRQAGLSPEMLEETLAPAPASDVTASIGVDADDMAELAAGASFDLTIKGHRAVREIRGSGNISDDVVHSDPWDDKFRAA